MPKEAINSETRTICAVCAWRDNCRKKYTYQENPVGKCPDYTRDLRIPLEEDE